LQHNKWNRVDKVPLDPLALADQWVLLELVVYQVNEEPQGLMDNQDLEEKRVHVDNQDLMDLLVDQVVREEKVKEVPEVLLDHQDCVGQMVQQENQDHEDH